MKKSFLNTFVVLGIFSIFLFLGLSTVSAANRTVTGKIETTCDPYYLLEKLKPGDKIPCTRTNYSDGTYSYTKGSGVGSRTDYYDKNGNKLLESQWHLTESGATSNLENQPKDLVASDNDTLGITDALQEFYATGLIWASKGVSWIVGLTGVIFDQALKYTTTYPNDLAEGIYGSWKIVRDFANIVLVFSLLYLGIRTILDGQGFADKKVLAGIIIAAVFINFSFFFTKDIAFNISNTVGLQIMQQAKVSSESYSAGFMQIVNPQQVLSGQTASQLALGTWDTLFQKTGQMFLLSMVLLLLGIIFLGVSLTLIYRLLIFIVLIIASPFGLISTQIPWIKPYGKMWTDQLQKQTLYFPAFALILYIVLYIVTTLATAQPLSINVSDSNSVFMFIFKFIMIIGFMLGLLILPAKLGAAGSSVMTKASGEIKKRAMNIPRSAGGLAAGGAARSGRFVGSRVGNWMGQTGNDDKSKANLKKLQETAQGTGVAASIARQRLRTSEKLKDSTYDFRNTKLGGSLKLGKGIESYNATVKKKKEAYAATRDKEEKLFGFDKVAKTQENKEKLLQAETERNIQGAKVEKIKEEKKTAEKIKDETLRNATIKDINDRLEKEQKSLEKAEEEVGRIMNTGKAEYADYLERKRKRIFKISRRVSRTEKAALEKMREDDKKKWKEDGKYKVNKKKKEPAKPTTTSAPTVTIGTSGGTTTI